MLNSKLAIKILYHYDIYVGVYHAFLTEEKI
jgi:hypothetical protein